MGIYAYVDGARQYMEVHPTFLYESLWNLLGFVLLVVIARKWRKFDGQMFLSYFAWYGVGRGFIEGLRTDSLIIPGTGLRVSQVIAAACVVAGIILLVVFRHKTSLTGCGDPHVMEPWAWWKPPSPAGGGAHRQHHLWGFARGRGAGNLL